MHTSTRQDRAVPQETGHARPTENTRPAAWRATYRVQLHADFDLDDAAAIVDYLAELGVSHLYASPSLQAAAGSTHGYDVVDPHHVNTELGGEAAHARLHKALRSHGLGHLLDIVPNHMAIGGRENTWWWDVLENGQSSRYAAYFDVDWDPPEAKLRDRILLPILGERYGTALLDRSLVLRREGGAFTIAYHDHVVPVAPRSLGRLLALAAARCDCEELAFLADASTELPPATATDSVSVARRHRDKEVLRRLLAELFEHRPEAAAAVDAVAKEIEGNPQLFDELLERQNYRLTFWRASDRELDYRRFFDINSLAALRVHDPGVFADTHALILRWLDKGILDGVRIDHIDGLRDPDLYLTSLHERAPGAKIWVEKILEQGERLTERWPIAGTTGYDFLNVAGGLFVDRRAEEPLTKHYAEIASEEQADYVEIARENKLRVLRESLGSDVNRLTALLQDICQQHWPARDFTRHELQEVLRELVADFPVYRTYVRAEEGVETDGDRRTVVAAIAEAHERRPDVDGAIFDFVRDVLTLDVAGPLAAEFVMRFQQLTGPAMAKGVEDTTFYTYNRLLALNEVGADPGTFGHTIADFHAHCLHVQQHWPETLVATSTHDTKRSEDVRARLAVLTEVPEAWRAVVTRWVQHNAGHRIDGMPDRNAEYLFYQTLAGAWPLDTERATAYMLKAAREGKAYTSWTEQNGPYEEALGRFVAAVLDDETFVRDLAAFVESIRDAGWVNSLGQTLLKLAAPGVPDIYQGTELWDLSLVDPDNRRPVDYALRRRLLGELDHLGPAEIWARRDEGLPKLWLVRQALSLRRRDPAAFGPAGDYAPLEPAGAEADVLVAFTRAGRIAAVVPRFGMRALSGWTDTSMRLPDGTWRDVLAGGEAWRGTVRIAHLLRRFPVALLARE